MRRPSAGGRVLRLARPSRRAPARAPGAFSGVLVADGYAGFNGLYETGRVGGGLTEAGCWAHVRRKIFDVHAATGSLSRRRRWSGSGRSTGSSATCTASRPMPAPASGRPLEAAGRGAEGLDRDEPGPVPGRSDLAKALRYMLARWPALMRAFDDGRLALDNNAAERALRCVAVGRKNYLFAGSELGAERAAAFYTLIETAKMNGLDPEAYLRDVLTRIADHPARRLADLLPWNWMPTSEAEQAA